MQKLAKIPTSKLPAAMVAQSMVEPVDNVLVLNTDDRAYQVLGSVVLLGVLGVFAVWAALAPLNSASVASGKVVVEMKKQVVQHREGGVIQNIFVDDGAYVQKGQKLMEISPTEADVDKSVIHEQLLGSLGLEARLNAELEGLDAPVFPVELMDNTQNKARSEEVMADELQQFKARRSAFVSEQVILKQKQVQLKEQIQGIDNQIKTEQALEKSYAKEAAQLQALFNKQLISNLQLNEAERNRLATATTIAELESNKAALNVQMGQTEEQLVLQRNEFNKEVTAKLSEARLKIADLQNRLKAATDKLERTMVVAPEAGTVVDLVYHTKGGVVQPGARILDIVPKIDAFQVDAKVNISDIDKVHAGLEADIRFPAFASSSFLKVTPGEVKLVSADTVVDEVTKQSFYNARVEIKPEGVADLDKHGLKLVQGMPAEVSIKTGERTFLQYLLKPITNMWNHAFNED